MDDKWDRVAATADVDRFDTFGVETGDGAKICLYRLEDGYHATADICSHGEALLSDGIIIDDKLIECPLHEGTFDIRSGAAVGPPCERPICTFEVKVVDGELFLKR